MIPIEGSGDGFLGRQFLKGGGKSAGAGGEVRFHHIADRAGPDDFGGHPLALVREALVAHLGGDLVFHGRLLEQAGLPRSARQRLLDIHVLASLDTGKGHRGMHEIGDSDGDRVDVLLFLVEHDAEVLIEGKLLVALDTGRGAIEIHIAEGHDVLRPGGAVQVSTALAAAADGRDIQFVVVRFVAEGSQRGHAAEARGRHRAGQ